MNAGTAPQVDCSHYRRGYDDRGRFGSYWHQIDETTSLGGRVLEIGIGNGTVSAVLRARGLHVTTVDIDPALGPDVVADIRELPFRSRSFDTLLAAEVLEHLPWDDVPIALGEIARVARRGVVLSVPNGSVSFALEARIPNALHVARMALRRRLPIRHALWALSQPGTWRRSGTRVSWMADVDRIHNDLPPTCRQHFWELGVRGTAKNEFVAILEQANLRLARDFRAPSFPYHHFFVLTVAPDPRGPAA
jgi:SAM-dependent methyltransferase